MRTAESLGVMYLGEAASKLQPSKAPFPTSPFSCPSAPSVLELLICRSLLFRPCQVLLPSPVLLPLLFRLSWRPSQTVRSLTLRTSSISLRLEYTNLRTDSEKAEARKKRPRRLCE